MTARTTKADIPFDRSRFAPGLAYVIFLGAAISGCAHVGPELISNGRPAYNRAIADTDNQQMLMIAIRDRYQERGSLLAVTSVTANVSVSANAEVEAGFGDKDNYRGNLTPFTGRFAYEENPTITYTPVDGLAYIRQLTTPVQLAGIASLTGAVMDPTLVYSALVSGVNGIYNPDFPLSGDDLDPRFDRFVQIMTTLHRAHRLAWVEEPGKPGQYSIVIEDFRPRFSDQVEELFRLLDLPMPAGDVNMISVPVSPYSAIGNTQGIRVKTRSVYKLVEILSASIQVPEEDLASGIASAYPQPGPVAAGVSVRYSKDEPDGAYVAVNYRDGWFYIADSDLQTKRFFRVIGSLWGVAIAETTARSQTPVLTVPVSR